MSPSGTVVMHKYNARIPSEHSRCSSARCSSWDLRCDFHELAVAVQRCCITRTATRYWAELQSGEMGSRDGFYFYRCQAQPCREALRWLAGMASRRPFLVSIQPQTGRKESTSSHTWLFKLSTLSSHVSVQSPRQTPVPHFPHAPPYFALAVWS
jgi:hypothetical protein